jgi:hypothetical protein
MMIRRILAVLVLALALVGCARGGAAPAPEADDLTVEARSLVERFFTLVQNSDVDGLGAFLSPAFQLQRADGSASAKPEYLTNLPTVETFEISDLVGTQTGSVLVARYLATVEGVVEGKPFTPGPAPRLSVFSWDGEAWQIVAHANFNPLSG